MNDQIKAFVNLKFAEMVLQIFMYQSCSIMLEPRGPAFAKRLFIMLRKLHILLVLISDFNFVLRNFNFGPPGGQKGSKGVKNDFFQT